MKLSNITINDHSANSALTMTMPVHGLSRTDPLEARVKEIYIGGERAGPMRYTSTVQALAGKGLLGDRYAAGTGSYSRSKGIRDVTLIEIEAVWNFYRVTGIDLHSGLLRRNIVTEGVPLSDLIGASFTIGSVSFFGLRPCPPCNHLAKLVGISDVLKGFAHSGGIYAQVLTDGVIRVDDTLIKRTDTAS